MTGTIRGRLTNREINSFDANPRDLEIESTAHGASIPIIYGRRAVPGLMGPRGVDASGNLIVCVFWCYGEVFQIEKVFYNGKALPDAVQVHHYRGTEYQGVDNWLADITTIISFSDDMVLLKPEGKVGIAYSVFKIAPSDISENPRFQAIIQGRTVYDVREANSNGDPFDSGDNTLVGYNLNFTGTNGTSPTTGIDDSTNALTVAWAGDADIQSNQLSLDGNGDYVTVQDVAAAEFGSGKWTLEITCTPTAATGIRQIFGKGDLSSDRSISIAHINANLAVSMSSDGTTWDIASVVTFASSALSGGTEVKITVEYTGSDYQFYVDGEFVHRIADASPLYNASGAANIGFTTGAGATGAFNGSIRGVRLTKGVNRYGGVHVATANPYADSNAMSPGYVFDNLTVKCFSELMRNPFYGFGVSTVANQLKVQEWNEKLLGGAVERSNLDLVISDVRPTEEWADLIANQGGFYWFPDGDGVRVVADRPVNEENPVGWELSENGEFEVDATDWTLGTGWSHNATLAALIKTAGTASDAEQTIAGPFEAGVAYIFTLKVPIFTAGSVRLEYNGVPFIEDQTSAGLYTTEYVANGTEPSGTFAVVADSAFAGWVEEASIKRKFWYDSNVVAGSLRIEPLQNADAPTRVILTYLEPDDDSPNWEEAAPVIESLPGVDTGETPLIETRVRMRGVTRGPEAANHAQSRLMRARDKVRISWKTTDIGIAYQKGSVIDLFDPEFNVRVYVLVENVTMVEHGRYQVVGSRYSDQHYPDQLVIPGGGGTVPVGAIALLQSGFSAPTGWADYSAINDKFVKGAGAVTAIGATGGATTIATQSGDTTEAGAHGPSETGFNVESYTGFSSTGNGFIYTFSFEEAGAHDHTWSTGTITPDVYRRQNILIQKTGTAGTEIPEGVITFGLANLNYPNTVRWLGAAGRVLQASATTANAGSNAQTLSLTTGTTNDEHDHWTRSTISNGSPGVISFTDPYYQPFVQGGLHSHTATLSLTISLQRKRIAAYYGSDARDVGPGTRMLWPNSIASLPADWIVCDGRLGTENYDGYYLEISAQGSEEETLGDNTADINGFTAYSAYHKHNPNPVITSFTHATISAAHSNEVRHRHEITKADISWQPQYHALAVIEYQPNPVPGFADVALLISGGETDGTTDIVDNSLYTLAETIQGTGTLAYDESVLLFSTSTISNTGKRILYPSFEYGKKFTFEGFFNNSSTDEMVLFGNHLTADVTTFEVRKTAAGAIVLYVGDTIQITLSTAYTSGEWFYVALCYDYSEWRLYSGKDSVGTAVGGTYTDSATDVTDDLYLLDRMGGVADFVGNFAQFRVTRGAARYTGSVIAIPTSAFDINKDWLLEGGVWSDSNFWIDSDNWVD